MKKLILLVVPVFGLAACAYNAAEPTAQPVMVERERVIEREAQPQPEPKPAERTNVDVRVNDWR